MIIFVPIPERLFWLSRVFILYLSFIIDCSKKHYSLNEYFDKEAELNELIQFERDCLGHHLSELIKQEKAQEEAQRKILKQLTTETNKKQYWRWPAITLSRRKNSITGLDVR